MVTSISIVLHRIQLLMVKKQFVAVCVLVIKPTMHSKVSNALNCNSKHSIVRYSAVFYAVTKLVTLPVQFKNPSLSLSTTPDCVT